MTDRKEALEALLAKVMAGECSADGFNIFVDPYDDDSPQVRNYAYQSYNGSLDAALALHEAVLPGEWFSSCGSWGACVSNDATHVSDSYQCESATYARAWLIAIIKALISEASQ
jgi:hypothetical protein